MHTYYSTKLLYITINVPSYVYYRVVIFGSLWPPSNWLLLQILPLHPQHNISFVDSVPDLDLVSC